MRPTLARLAALSLAALLAACSTRSISDSGYRSAYGHGPGPELYRGELDAYDVLGLDPTLAGSDEDIAALLDRPRVDLRLVPGERVGVVQSGALVPDHQLLAALAPHVEVLALSGIPRDERAPRTTATLLRVAAAQAGVERLLVAWGTIETAAEHTEGAVVSWVPIVGWGLADTELRQRLRLQLALIDVRTGQWDLILPPDVWDETTSSPLTRESKDQQLVARVKQRGYAAAVAHLVEAHMR